MFRSLFPTPRNCRTLFWQLCWTLFNNFSKCTDGSCFCGTDPVLAAAGAAAVQVYPDGTPARAAWVTLPSWLPQTAASAEHTAVSLAVSIDPTRSLNILSDCASVVASAKDREWATQHSRPFAAIWRDMPLAAWPTVDKVKAHRSQQQAQAEGDLKHWHGNEAADNFAKGAALHNLPAKVLQEAQEGAMHQGKKMLVALATLFSKWPKYHEAIKTGTWTPSGKPHKREAKFKRKHEWKWSKERKHYRCDKCHSTAYCTI